MHTGLRKAEVDFITAAVKKEGALLFLDLEKDDLGSDWDLGGFAWNWLFHETSYKIVKGFSIAKDYFSSELGNQVPKDKGAAIKKEMEEKIIQVFHQLTDEEFKKLQDLRNTKKLSPYLSLNSQESILNRILDNEEKLNTGKAKPDYKFKGAYNARRAMSMQSPQILAKRLRL